MSALQDPTGEKAQKLFGFKAPALIDFEFAGILEGNNLYLETSLGFGPYQSGVRRIPLANIAHQFSLVLAAMHGFVSVESREKTIKALNNFRLNDVREVGSLKLLLTPGSHIVLYSSHFKKYVSMRPEGAKVSGQRELKDGLPLSWSWERFVVVDAGMVRSLCTTAPTIVSSDSWTPPWGSAHELQPTSSEVIGKQRSSLWSKQELARSLCTTRQPTAS